MQPSTLDESVLKRNAIAYWRQSPGNRPVKLTSLRRHPTLWTEGYVTCHKFIAGRTLVEAERILGLNAGELRGGAYLFEFLRLPEADEFTLRGYTQCPDGRPWTSDSAYPVGTGAAQWQVHRDAYIPSRLVCMIQAGQPIP